MKAFLRAWTGLLPLLIAVVLLIPGIALAQGKMPGTTACFPLHCWGIVDFNPGTFAFLGAQTDDSVRGLGLGGNTKFLTNEVWLADTITYKSQGVSPWVEAGYGMGLNTVLNSHCGYNESFFWADYRANGGGFNIHCPAYVGSGDKGYNVRDCIWQDGTDSSAWFVRITPHSSAQMNGKSTTNTMFPNDVDFGEDLSATDDGQGVNAPRSTFVNNYYMDLNLNWHFWHNPPYAWNMGLSGIPNDPPWFGWVNGEDPNHDSTGGKLYACTVGTSSC